MDAKEIIAAISEKYDLPLIEAAKLLHDFLNRYLELEAADRATN